MVNSSNPMKRKRGQSEEVKRRLASLHIQPKKHLTAASDRKTSAAAYRKGGDQKKGKEWKKKKYWWQSVVPAKVCP